MARHICRARGVSFRLTSRRRALLGMGGVVLAMLLMPARAPAQEVGVPWTGAPGITETVDQIMARDAGTPTAQPPVWPVEIVPLRGRDRSRLPQNPLSEKLLPGRGGPSGGLRNPQTVGTSFRAVDMLETLEGPPGMQTIVIPPDTMGDVSPTQVLVCLNRRIKVFDKTGTVGALNSSTDNFFATVRNGSPTGDPRVVWDRTSQRWFVVMFNSATPNRILIAVSNGATITSGGPPGPSSFTFFQFQQDMVGTQPNSDTGFFADYESLGVDANALYIGTIILNGNTVVGTTGWVVRKSDLLMGTLTVTAFRQLAVGTGAGPDRPRGVTNDDAAATEGYFIGGDNSMFGRLVVRRVTNPGGAPAISGNIFVNVPATANPINVPAQGSTTNVDVNDDRLFDARIHLNRVDGQRYLWTAHCIRTNNAGAASGTGDRDSSRWYQIQNLTGVPALVQSGTLFDNAGANPRFFFFPTVAMTGQGHMALGCTAAGATEFLEVAVAGRLVGDAAGATQAPTTAQTSSTSYTIVPTGDTRNRWGDYSSTVVDPADDQSIWTFQEYCDGTNSWGVQAIRLLAPPPATVTACDHATLAPGDTSVDLLITGTPVSGSAFYDTDSTYPNRIGARITNIGSGLADVVVNSVTWLSTTQARINVSVPSNAPCGTQRIVVVNPDQQNSPGGTGLLCITAPIVCPPAVTITCGESTAPSNTGQATTPTCGSATITHTDVVTPTTCPADPVMFRIARTFTAHGPCGDMASCTQTITVLKVVVAIDIKPGACPNPFNPASNGVLSASLLGRNGFDVTTIVPTSVRISRADCVGSTAPISNGPPGPGWFIRDSSRPFAAAPCTCPSRERDGIMDLSVKFHSDEITAACQLAGLAAGTTVELVVSGVLTDGCQFVGHECVTIVGSGSAGERPDVDDLADWNSNGEIDPGDVSLFVHDWFEGLDAGTPLGDIDGNGRVEPADLGVFVSRWLAALHWE